MLVPDELWLRFAGADDAVQLAALRTAGLIEMGMLGPAEAVAFADRARRELRALLNDERMIAWVLVAGGRLAGCACVVFWERLPYPGTSRHAELAGVYVAPAFRRRGIARELVAEALASARAHGVRRVFIAPTPQMHRLYRSFDFDDAGWLRSPLNADTRHWSHRTG